MFAFTSVAIFHHWRGCSVVFGLCGRCSAVFSLPTGTLRKDLRKLASLIYSYPFFYIRYELVQDFVQFLGTEQSEVLLRIGLVTRFLSLFFKDVTPSSSPVDFLRFLPVEPGS